MTIEDIIQRIKLNKEELGITLYPPADQFEINGIADSLNISFPSELNEFYLFCNGFESEEDLFRIVPLNEMRFHANKLQDNQLCIAEYLIYCDSWNITINGENGSYEISESTFHTTLTNSFIEFLECFLNDGVFGKNGLYKWRESIIANQSS